ncbi:MAG: heparinase II/III family protein [Pirellulales bacterium]|nr:heparinase II/III family protein [Pirellulales bacterium]
MNHSAPLARLFVFAMLCSFASTLLLFPNIAMSDDVDSALVEKWIELLPAKPLGLGRPIGDRDAWEDVKKRNPKWENIVASAEKLIDKPILEVTNELYLEFFRNGNRTNCQRVMSDTHHRIATLVFAECLENKGRFLPEIERMIRAVSAQKSWVLPAHDHGQSNIKGTQITIDLVSSRVGLLLATTNYWLGDRLSPEIRKTIDTELERRVFKPFEGSLKHNKPKLWWLHCTNNWNAVCLANVAGTAVTAIDSKQRRAYYMAAAQQHIKHFLDGFTPDGYCSEGLSYWVYGFGHFTLLAEIVSQQTDGKFELWDAGTEADRAKLRRIARYGRQMEILPGIYPALADCPVSVNPPRYLMAYLGLRLGFGGDRYGSALLTLSESRRGPSSFGAFGFSNSATRQPEPQAESTHLPRRKWYEDAGVLICRPGKDAEVRSKFGVAIKGGHNAEHHNHNDVGTFIVAVGKNIPLVDPGSEVYTRRTFSSKRYESGILNSWGHPVPRVAGKLQSKGRKAAAKVLSKNFTEETDTITFDISRAYNVKSLKRLERSFVYSRKDASSLTVTDEVKFDSPQSFGTALVTFDKWKLVEPESQKPSNSKTLRVGSGTEAVDVTIECEASTIEIQPETIDEDVRAKKKPIRLGIELTKPVKQAKVRMTIRPAGS